MNINFKNNFDCQFMDLEGGQPFVYGSTAYMKLDTSYENNGVYDVLNAVSLLTGELNCFNSGDWVKTLQFKGEWYIG